MVCYYNKTKRQPSFFLSEEFHTFQTFTLLDDDVTVKMIISYRVTTFWLLSRLLHVLCSQGGRTYLNIFYK